MDDILLHTHTIFKLKVSQKYYEMEIVASQTYKTDGVVYIIEEMLNECNCNVAG